MLFIYYVCLIYSFDTLGICILVFVHLVERCSFSVAYVRYASFIPFYLACGLILFSLHIHQACHVRWCVYYIAYLPIYILQFVLYNIHV